MGFINIEKTDGLAILWLDQSGEKINKISFDLVDEFSSILDDLQSDNEIDAIIIISNKKDNFIAGADIEAFLKMDSPGVAEAASRKGNQVLSRIASFNKPVVAAIHGAALGGGLEVALACSYRIASDDPKTILGLPEIKLGLLPAGGGTQRLPRLIGLQRGLDMLLTGRNIFPRRAKRMGLVDDLIHPYGLLEAAKSAARSLTKKPLKRKVKLSWFVRMFEAIPLGRRFILKRASDLAQKQTKGNYPAPQKIIECVQAGLTNGIAAGLEAESRCFDQLMQSSQAKELINLFFAMNKAKKNPKEDLAVSIDKIGILGAGLMGSGIAEVSVMNGMEVVLKDIDLAAVGRGERKVWKNLQRRMRKGALSRFERDLVMSRITGTDQYDRLSQSKLVIEAVIEDIELKRKVLAEVEDITNGKAIFASNTSALPIKDIAKGSKRPENVIGMHYFSPVPRMPLLEIIITAKTEEWVIATAAQVGIRQGKHLIVVKDGPGFYTTRILSALMNEAIIMLESGGDIQEIDQAMLRFGFPVGPFALMDEVGLDVCSHVTQVLSDMFSRRGVTVGSSIDKIVDAGHQGRKDNSGFYNYPRKKRGLMGIIKHKKQVNPAIYSFCGGVKRRTIPGGEIQKRLSMAMVNEALLCLQEDIIQSPGDGDLGAVLGLGFPPFLGGPFRYIDSVGASKSFEILEKLQADFGEKFAPPEILKEMKVGNKRFYKN